MQPLGGLAGRKLAEYHDLLATSHDFELDLDILGTAEQHLGSVTAQFKDGQVNIQRDGVIKRTATFTFYDPDHALHLDSESPFAGAVFADRLIRVRHAVRLSDGTRVVATPFVGPVVQIGREGADLRVECQDKTVFATSGCPTKTVKKGHNAVDAIHDIMYDCTGERRFRFPANHGARLKRAYSVGWKDEASPWAVCQKIAAAIDLELIYSGDGALVLRRRPTSPVLTIAEGGLLTGMPRADYDATSVKNIVRVTGSRKPKKSKKQVKFTEVAAARSTHPLSARNLGRNGVPRYLPLLIDDSGIHKASAAHARAVRELAANLPMSVSMQAPSVPFFHLDYGDPIRISTDFGDAIMPFIEGSIPLGIGGDQQVGAQKRVSTPRRRV